MEFTILPQHKVFNPHLTLDEEEALVIKKVCALQLITLDGLLSKDYKPDIIVYASKHELDHEELKAIAKARHIKIHEVYENPSKLLFLNKLSLEVIKHMLYTEVTNPAYQGIIKRLKAKIDFLERLNTYNQPN